MANEIPPTPIPQPLPVGPPATTPPPVQLQIPPFVVPLVYWLWQLINSRLAHTGILAALIPLFVGNAIETKLNGAIDKVTPKIGEKILPIINKILPPKLTAQDAIGKIQFGKYGCTATVIGPVGDADETLEILTAAHCVKVGEHGQMKLRDGRQFAVQCVSRDAASDAAWLVAKRPAGEIPCLYLAASTPAFGSGVWHAGFGIDKPGNREAGSLKGVTSDGRKCWYRLSVSSGDSGGAIVLTDDDMVLSPVCCSNNRGGMGDVFGATPAACQRIRPSAARTIGTPLPSCPNGVCPVLFPVPEDWL